MRAIVWPRDGPDALDVFWAVRPHRDNGVALKDARRAKRDLCAIHRDIPLQLFVSWSQAVIPQRIIK